jgi:hypothetical protein
VSLFVLSSEIEDRDQAVHLLVKKRKMNLDFVIIFLLKFLAKYTILKIYLRKHISNTKSLMGIYLKI